MKAVGIFLNTILWIKPWMATGKISRYTFLEAHTPYHRNKGDDFCTEKWVINSFSDIMQPKIIEIYLNKTRSSFCNHHKLGAKQLRFVVPIKWTNLNINIATEYSYFSIFYIQHQRSFSVLSCLLYWSDVEQRIQPEPVGNTQLCDLTNCAVCAPL